MINKIAKLVGKVLFLAFAIVTFSTMPASKALAMAVTPIVVDIEPIGKNARADVNVSNTAASDVPVAISVQEVTIRSDGSLDGKDDDSNFVIYPAQSIIKAGGNQRFRIQWVGEPEIKQARTFILSVAQQPVKMPEGQSGIQILYNFQVIVTVNPVGAKPDLMVERTNIVRDEKGVARGTLTLKNNGIGQGFLSGCKLKLEAFDKSGKSIWSKNLEPEELAQSVGVGIVQPNSNRVFNLPFDLPEGAETLSASVKYVGRQ